MRNIKIVIAGLNCSGKTTLIKDLEKKYNIEFIEGSKKLCEIAGIKKEELKLLDKEEKQKIRKQFLEYIQTCNNQKSIIVDGHYSFIDNNGEIDDIAMGEEDFKVYDVVLFLDIDICQLQKRLLERDTKDISLEVLQKWYNFELDGLQKKSREYQKFFSVIDNDSKAVGDFINALQNNPETIMPQYIFESFMEDNRDIINKHKRVILVDCDGTLSGDNMIKEFYKIKAVESYKIENAFHGHRYYGFYQFFRLTQKRLEIEESKFLSACSNAAQSVELNWNLINSLISQEATVVAITLGLRACWHEIFQKYNIPFLCVSNNRYDVIAQDTKGYFAQELVNLGYEVMAIGDDIGDAQMLENAHKPIIIESKKDLYHMLTHRTRERSMCIKANMPIKWESTMVVELAQKYPLKNLINQTRIKNISSIELSKIHHELGKFLAMEILGLQTLKTRQEILSTGKIEQIKYYDDNNFVIIAILRAGLFMAEGVREIFHKANFILSKSVNDIKDNEYLNNKNIIFVDSVINTGDTIKEYLNYLEDKTNKIYVATNVIYRPTIEKLSKFDVDIFTIRISDNTYKGQWESDTGNRLFNIINEDKV